MGYESAIKDTRFCAGAFKNDPLLEKQPLFRQPSLLNRKEQFRHLW
jgi:hypothetical protein